MKSALTLAVLAALIALLLWAFSESLPFRSEVTVYNMFCTGERKGGQCDAEEQTANTATYKAFAEQQTVVYWYGDNDAPKRLWHCAVRDARNWSCQWGVRLEQLPELEYQMVNGEFSEYAPGVPDHRTPGVFYRVSKWHWWLVWLSEKAH